MEHDMWNSREAIIKTLLKPPVKQTEMKKSNTAILVAPVEWIVNWNYKVLNRI